MAAATWRMMGVREVEQIFFSRRSDIFRVTHLEDDEGHVLQRLPHQLHERLGRLRGDRVRPEHVPPEPIKDQYYNQRWTNQRRVLL